MNTIIIAVGILVLIGTNVAMWQRRRREKEELEALRRAAQEAASNNNGGAEGTASADGNAGDRTSERTCADMLRALRGIGCQPQEDEEEENAINVQYQGEKFYMICGGPYVKIWDPAWAEIKIDNPHYPLLREAVNFTNFGFGPTLVATRPSEDGTVVIHSRRDIMLYPEMGADDREGFVRATLDSFFEVKQTLKERMDELRARQDEGHPVAVAGAFSVN